MDSDLELTDEEDENRKPAEGEEAEPRMGVPPNTPAKGDQCDDATVFM